MHQRNFVRQGPEIAWTVSPGTGESSGGVPGGTHTVFFFFSSLFTAVPRALQRSHLTGIYSVSK